MTYHEVFGTVRALMQRAPTAESVGLVMDLAAHLAPHEEREVLSYVQQVMARQYDTEARALFKASASKDFEAYCRTLDWAHDLQWFHRVLCLELKLWLEASNPYVLVLVLPPGHAKSTYARKALGWMCGRDPTSRIAYATYSQDVADEMSLLFKSEVMGSPEHREVFPDCQLPGATSRRAPGLRDTIARYDLVDRFGARTGGSIRFTSLGGPLTSLRCDAIVIDDPIKDPKAAASKVLRDDQMRWVTRVAMTRKRPGRPLRLMVVITRWHHDDVVGRLKEDGHDTREVRFEALKNEVDHPEDPRESGEALWPAVYDETAWERLRELDPPGFWALGQGAPTGEEGAEIKAGWLRYYRELPPGRFIQSWDLKQGSTDARSSEAVGQLWLQPDEDPERLMLVSERAGVWDWTETLMEFDRAQDEPGWFESELILVEAKGDGTNLISVRGGEFPIEGIQPDGDKRWRMRKCAPVYRAGRIEYPHPQDAPWIIGHRDQVTSFPASTKDDRVDAESQVINFVLLEGLDYIDPRDLLDAQEEALRILGY